MDCLFIGKVYHTLNFNFKGIAYRSVITSVRKEKHSLSLLIYSVKQKQ